VTDDGVGISPEARAHLFEPFFTTKPQGKGTGLGLPFVYGLVRQSGGFIVVDNPPRGGTAVTLHFPAIGLVGPHVDYPDVPGRETILLVEYEDPVRAVIGALLRRNGYTVLEASTPQGAIKIFQLHLDEIALLLTDVVMPEMSGRALAEQCVEEKPALRVLFVSSRTGGASLESTGPHVAFLEKPFPAAVLTTMVRTLLDRTE
jgi:CheY-like chemotaxis protein